MDSVMKGMTQQCPSHQNTWDRTAPDYIMPITGTTRLHCSGYKPEEYAKEDAEKNAPR